MKRASRGRRKRNKGKEDHDSPSFVTNFLAHYKYMEFYFNPIFLLLMRYLFSLVFVKIVQRKKSIGFGLESIILLLLLRTNVHYLLEIICTYAFNKSSE